MKQVFRICHKNCGFKKKIKGMPTVIETLSYYFGLYSAVFSGPLWPCAIKVLHDQGNFMLVT